MPKWSALEILLSDPGQYRLMLKRRGLDESIVDGILRLREKHQNAQKRYQLAKTVANKLSAQRKTEEARQVKSEVTEAQAEKTKTQKEYDEAVRVLPNIILPEVPDGRDESSDVVLSYGRVKAKIYREDIEEFRRMTGDFLVPYETLDKKPVGHAEILEDLLGLVDTQQAGRVSGSRFYYMKKDLVYLDLALSLWAIREVAKKGFTPIIPPYMIRNSVLWGAIDKSIFEDMVYCIQGEELCLLGTAEHALLGFLHERNDVRYDELPIRLAGWSPCFRKEAGSHGSDTKGIFRVHQFHKVEQFIFNVHGQIDDDRQLHREMVSNVENLVESLELPYRTVNKCVGELGSPYALKHDVEVWFPNQGRYREMASASLCLDWQAYRNDMTYMNKEGKREYYHTMNSTALPISRAVSALAENGFSPDEKVIRIPRPLWSIMEVLLPLDTITSLVKG